MLTEKRQAKKHRLYIRAQLWTDIFFVIAYEKAAMQSFIFLVCDDSHILKVQM